MIRGFKTKSGRAIKYHGQEAQNNIKAIKKE